MRLAVIGGVAAGMSAAARARRVDPSLEITVFEKGAEVSYGACGLPYWISGRVRERKELITYTAEYFRRERGIEVRTGAEVVAVSPQKRELTLAGGERVRWDKLVIAAGARAAARGDGFVLPLLAAAGSVRAMPAAATPGRAVGVGAGYIGLELAGALRGRGWRVTLVDRETDLLGRESGWLTRMLRDHLARHGVELRLGPYEFLPSSELTVHAAGLAPEVSLAVEAGAELGRTGAVRVNERMETSVGGIYAAGDCCEAAHVVTGAPVWIPLGTTANRMGRVAGANAAGRRERFAGVAGTAVAEVCGLGVAVTGLSEAQAKRAGFGAVAARVEAMERAAYFGGRRITVELVADRASRRLVGAAVVGERGVTGRINLLAAALQARMRVEDLLDLDLAYAPPYGAVTDAVTRAARELERAL